MSHWYDFSTVLPPAGEMVRLRRYPEHTPSFFGVTHSKPESVRLALDFTFVADGLASASRMFI